MRKTLFFLFIAAIVYIVVLSTTISRLRAENERYKANQNTLLGEVEYYKAESGNSAASVQKLTLTYKELEKNYEDVVKTAKELDIKLKRIESTSATSTKTQHDIVTVIRDSIVYRNSTFDSIKCFDWRDTWTDIKGEIKEDSVSLSIQSTDTIKQIVHRVPHKFWFIKWGTKAIRQEVVSSNPHTNITYTEFIELK